MAMKLARTKVSLVLLIVNLVVQTNCENDIRQKYMMPELSDEHLLRSSEETADKKDQGSIQLPLRREYDPILEEASLEEANASQYDIEKPETTTDYNHITTDDENDSNEEVAHKMSAKSAALMNRRAFDEEDVTTPDGNSPTDPTLDDTLSNTDRIGVYKYKDIAEGGYYEINNRSNMEHITRSSFAIEAQSTTPPAEEIEATEPKVSKLEDDQLFAQRSAKAENSEIKPSVEKHTFQLAAPEPEDPVSKKNQLKDWLEDPWLRSPSGILVPLRPEGLRRALAVWKDLIAEEGLAIKDVVIVGYDENGVNWRSRHNLLGGVTGNGNKDVTEVLSKLLFKYQDVTAKETAGDATMKALTAAAKLVPYDSALFVVTDKGATDGHKLPLAVRALIEKRLKVYTIWTDPEYPSPESEAAVQELRNISAITEGNILPYSLQLMDEETQNNAELETEHLDSIEMPKARTAKMNSIADEKKEHMETLLVKRGGGGALSLGVPVETGVTALRVYIEGAVEHAILYPPNEAPQIDLYNLTSVESFSRESRTESLSPRDVYLMFPGAKSKEDLLSVMPMTTAATPAPTAGVWHLSVRCDSCDYRLTVRARANLRLRAVTRDNGMLNIRLIGPVSTVRESTLVDEYGTELSKLPFSYQPVANEVEDPQVSAVDQALVADVKLPEIKASRVYVKIVGRDVNGDSFVRLASLKQVPEVRMSRSASISFPDAINDLELAEEFSHRLYDNRLRYNDSNVLPNNNRASQVVNQVGSLMTTVNIGLSSRIYGAPGDSLQLHFEVTNYREQSVLFRFEAIGELRFLRGINPASQTLVAGQTAVVIVSLIITATAQPGARDLITFTAYGLDQVSISTYVYVVNPDTTVSDISAPGLRHNFQGSCIGNMGDDCAQHVWSASIIARDAVGGLLRLSSTPIGLLYDSNFISGTREEVVASYRATCCAPRVLITAVDAFGNANSYIIDISNYFTPAAISAIVLGIFFVLILIVIIGFLIYWCVKRRQDSRELPSYSTRRDVN